MNVLIQRLLALVRRVFFWLPGSSPSDEHAPEHSHDHALILNVTSPRRVPRYRQLRYAIRILSISEQRAVLISIGTFILSLGLAGGFFLTQRSVRIPIAGGLFTEALIGQPKYLTPIDAPANDVDRDIVSLVYSGLFRMNGMDPVPDLAERYIWTDGGKTLTVTIRSDARFHNGDIVSADDVQYTIDQIQDPARTSPLASLFRGVKAFALDEHTVQFTLDQPNIYFLSTLTTGILPSKLWRSIPASNARLADLNIKPIGSGPYTFQSFTRDSRGSIRSFTLERSSTYYGIKPFIQTITFQFFSDRAQAEDALKGDVIGALAFTDLGNTLTNPQQRWTTIHLNLPQETIAFFNNKNKILSDPRIRQALDGVVERQDIVDAWKGKAQPIFGPFPFLQTTSTALSIDQARALLDEAGWVLPKDGSVRIFVPKVKVPVTSTKNKNTKTVATPTVPVASASSTELAIAITTSNQPELVATAEVLQRRWSLLGIRVNIEQLEAADLVRKATRTRDAGIILTNILLDQTQDLFPFWWSGQAIDRGFNIANLTDRDVDNALLALRAASTTQALEADRLQVSQLITRSHPAVFLVRPAASYLVSKNIQGINPNTIISQPANRFQDLTHWYIKTGWRWK